MLIHTVGPWHTLWQFHIRGYFQKKQFHQNEKVEFWNLAMLTTQLMTMIQSREDQRVQRECHWSVPSPARTKAIKHQMSKWRKIDKVIKHQMTELGKMNNAKHSGMLFDFLTCLVQLWIQTNCEYFLEQLMWVESLEETFQSYTSTATSKTRAVESLNDDNNLCHLVDKVYPNTHTLMWMAEWKFLHASRQDNLGPLVLNAYLLQKKRNECQVKETPGL